MIRRGLILTVGFPVNHRLGPGSVPRTRIRTLGALPALVPVPPPWCPWCPCPCLPCPAPPGALPLPGAPTPLAPPHPAPHPTPCTHAPMRACAWC